MEARPSGVLRCRACSTHRLSADGVLDTSYGSSGYVTDDSYSDFDVASSGVAYVGSGGHHHRVMKGRDSAKQIIQMTSASTKAIQAPIA